MANRIAEKMTTNPIKPRLKAAAIHLGASAVIAITAAGIVLGLWYPPPYDQLSGGRQLFILLISVDVVVGPLLTLVVFNVLKPRRELIRDLSIIGIMQLSALAYGMNTVFVARPVVAAFEVNLVRVVAANQVLLTELPRAKYLSVLPLDGPRIVGTRRANNKELDESISTAFQGFDIGQRPAYWTSWDGQSALKASMTAMELIKRYPHAQADIESRLSALGLDSSSAHVLPVLAHSRGWVAVLDAQGQLVDYMPYGL